VSAFDARVAELRGLSALIEVLQARKYHFTTPTPATHARVIARRSQARDLRDVFGWSLPFAAGVVEANLLDLMRAAGVLEERGELFASRLRASSLEDMLFLHSAFPTTQHDAVFFGPDSYRFARFLDAELPSLGARAHLVDLGAGSGVGAAVARRHLRNAQPGQPCRISLVDINPTAISLARANFTSAPHLPGMMGAAAFVTADGLAGVEGQIDVVIANPPYIADPARRAYRDGGGMHGAEISLRWAREAAERLSPGGALLLYTGSAIVGGEDRLKSALVAALGGFDISYREIDPDVFGEELEREDYRDVERIAVVGVVAVKRAS
jgi:methylase of polypeptide subunit release factors